MLADLGLSPPLGGWYNTAGVIVVLLTVSLLYRLGRDDGGPPMMAETIPFLSNMIAVVTKPVPFWDRALKMMQRLKTDIIRFRLGRVPVYVIVGDKKTNVLFRMNTGFSVKRVHNTFVGVMFGPSKEDQVRWLADTSGREKKRLPEGEHVEDIDRIWLRLHNSLHEYLLRTKPTDDLATWFFTNFIARTTKLLPLGKSTDMLIWDFIRYNQTDVAGRALAGDLVFDMNPGYIDTMRKFDAALLPVAFGPPRWVRPQPHIDREAFLAMNLQWMTKALALFDWDSPAASSSGWEPIFGSPLIRSIVRWGLEIGLSTQSISGICGIQLSGQNGNSVPASAWCILHALTSSDPDLLPNLTAESHAALKVDPTTGAHSFDLHKLISSPWLQAIYTETLRTKLTHSVIRDADIDTTLDGTKIPKGAMVYAPMPIAHNNPVWAVPGHPPQEFWPRRHLTSTVKPESGKEKWEFALGPARSGYFFPYGGGLTMCPGRNFAKQEIIGTLALFLTQFEVEVVGWVTLDGKEASERAAGDIVGMVVTQPDRDLKVRVTRRW